jgi:hypothetical protein
VTGKFYEVAHYSVFFSPFVLFLESIYMYSAPHPVPSICVRSEVTLGILQIKCMKLEQSCCDTVCCLQQLMQVCRTNVKHMTFSRPSLLGRDVSGTHFHTLQYHSVDSTLTLLKWYALYVS